MFQKLTSQQIIEKFPARKTILKSNTDVFLSDDFYTSYLFNYGGLEITPDIIIFSYEEALKENKYLTTNHPVIGEKFWMIGRTGQGDEWFIDKQSNSILFYDHNLGNYSGEEQFSNLGTSFLEFLQLAFLYQSLESLLDEKEMLNELEQENFILAINSIAPNLYESYPFNYW